MKKLVIVLVVVVLMLFIGAPYFTGKVAETETLKLVDKINESSLEYGATEVLSYDRGIRSTTARYKYTPPTFLAAFSKEFGEIVYVCDSSHGVMGIDYTCALEGESAYSKFVNDKLDGKDPFSVYGSISAFGGITQTIALDEVKDLDIEGSTLNIPNAKISVATDANTSEFNISGSSDSFSLEGEGQKLSLGKMTIDGDIQKIVGSLFSGDMLLELDHVDMQGALGNTSIKGISINSSTNERGDTISSKALFSVKEVVAAASPFESLEDLNLGLDLLGLDKQSVIDYQDFTQKMQRDILSSLENGTEPEANPADMAQMLPILEGMLKQGLEVNSKVSAKLNGEPNKVALDLKLLDSLTLAQMSLFMTNPDDALKKLDVSLDASLNKALVDSQPVAAAFIAQSPLVAAGKDDYTLDLKLGKKIKLNDKTMSFSELQALVFSSLPL